MLNRNATAAAGRIAVIDVGSNSLRLVVFEEFGGTLFPLLNEKVMCGLGRGIAATGKLNPDGVALALANLQRFVELARAIGVEHLAVIATAAVREARDGRAFAAEVERQCRVPVEIIDGAAEARLSAQGVLAGIPNADGVVGDLGGGSVELARIDGPRGRIGAGISLPIGPLRLAELGEGRPVVDAIERAIAGAAVLREAAGRDLYLVGGAWRAIARLHMEHARYPLHIIHQYTLARADAEDFVEIVERQSRKSLERIVSISRRRLEVVPLAASILRRLVAAAAPRHVVFSAFGLREGYAFGLIPPEKRTGDALIAGCAAFASHESRFRTDGERLQAWIAPAFPGLVAARRRLHLCACWLSDFAWAEHPDYRAGQAFTRSLQLPLAGIAHGERVFVATALHARYGGAAEEPVTAPTRGLIDEDDFAEARSLGLALRLAYTLCGGKIELLSEVWLGRDRDRVVLEIPESGSLFTGEAVQRRLDALGRSLGLAAELRRREPLRRARA
jgi:exopolyphosphatase/guanosine-5'-triphosphate,3'-diphosphate pyrophosphatase